MCKLEEAMQGDNYNTCIPSKKKRLCSDVHTEEADEEGGIFTSQCILRRDRVSINPYVVF